MKKKYFGTDGVRGTANKFPMTAEIALKVGMAAGAYFKQNGPIDERHKVVIGKDTRISGYMIEPALTAGLVAMGMDVVLLGPMPTPAVAMLTRSMRADLGIMITASHNHYEDNGIKLFDSSGLKLSDEAESKIESLMDNGLEEHLSVAKNLGRAKRLDDAMGRYIQHAKHSFPKNQTLKGLKIVLDCANGAAYKVAPLVLWELEAEVITLANNPDGFNINKECGSTNPENIVRAVLEHKADIGISLDGDADRVVVCDEKGHIIDGDQLMALIAVKLKKENNLTNNGLVATHMSNMGLEKFLKSQKIALKRTGVGDRYVSLYMRKNNYNLGGEQSGHIILRDYGTTGDGLIAALEILSVLKEENKKASEVLNIFKPWPQILKNLKLKISAENFAKFDIEKDKNLQKEIKEAQKILDKNKGGRILIRKSGTETLIRVMVEGQDDKLIEKIANSLSDRISENFK